MGEVSKSSPEIGDEDCMEEMFNDSIYNCYDRGPGCNLDLNLQLPLKNKDRVKIYKLYIKNIPNSLTESGLRHIFSNFGPLKSAFISSSKVSTNNNSTWGMVEYHNLRNAQEAIKNVNLQPPYNLEVKFALSETEKKRKLLEKKMLENRPSVAWPCKQRDDRALMVYFGVNPETLSFNSYLKDITNDYVLDYTYFNHFSQEYPCDATHRLLTNNCYYRNCDDVGYVYFASTTSDIVTPVSSFKYRCRRTKDTIEVTNKTQPLFDRECNGLYEYGADLGRGGKCEQCSIRTASACKACDAWCCGTGCLLKHTSNNLCNGNHKTDTDDNNISQEISDHSTSFDSTDTLSKEFDKPRNIVESLREGYTGLLLQIRTTLTTKKFIATLVCFQVEESHQIVEGDSTLETLPFSEAYEAKVGDVVALENMSEVGVEFPRGYIFSSGQAVLCDFGDVVSYEKIKHLPQEMLALPSLAVYCTLLECNKTEEQFHKEIVQDLKFNVTKCFENGSIEASFVNHENIDLHGKLILSPMFHFTHATIKSGSNVILSAFYNCATIYVQSVEPEAVELFEELMQDIGIHCSLEKEMTFEPILGDMVAAFNPVSKNWYRAQILKNGNDGFVVIYVDYGNIETVPLTSMKPLSSYLKNIPCCAIRVGLQDIPPKTPLNNRALKLILNLCESKKTLKMEYLNCNLQSVTLIRQLEFSLGEKLIEVNEPTWKKTLNMRPDIKVSDLKYTLHHLIEYKLSEGKEYRLCALLLSPTNQIIFFNTSCDLPQHVMSTLSPQLQTYCDSVKCGSYNPESGELCIVQSEDDGCWYRAVCLFEIFEQAQTQVMFLDFGNMCLVNHKNIRPFCGDFLNIPAMAITCINAGIPENCSEALNKRLKELIQLGSEYSVIVNSYDKNNCFYTIDIPSVTAVLVEEKLL